MGVLPVGYWIIRSGLAAAGLVAILGTVASFFAMPQLYYDDRPVPPMSERLPGIAAGFGLGALLLLPHRLTLRRWLFWPRLVASAAVGFYLVWAGLSGIVAGLGGGRSPIIFPVGVGLILAGVSVPSCLWWRRRGEPVTAPDGLNVPNFDTPTLLGRR